MGTKFEYKDNQYDVSFYPARKETGYTTVAVIELSGEVYYGYAFFNPNDTFNKEIGRTYAILDTLNTNPELQIDTRNDRMRFFNQYRQAKRLSDMKSRQNGKKNCNCNKEK